MTQEDDPPAPVTYAGPVKHSVTIRGHRTSISLEPVFWDALRRAAEAEGVALHVLVAQIDEERIATLSRSSNRSICHPANLATAIRIWLWMRYCK